MNPAGLAQPEGQPHGSGQGAQRVTRSTDAPSCTYGVERVALVDGVLVVRLQLVKRDDLQEEKGHGRHPGGTGRARYRGTGGREGGALTCQMAKKMRAAVSSSASM